MVISLISDTIGLMIVVWSIEPNPPSLIPFHFNMDVSELDSDLVMVALILLSRNNF